MFEHEIYLSDTDIDCPSFPPFPNSACLQACDHDKWPEGPGMAYFSKIVPTR